MHPGSKIRGTGQVTIWKQCHGPFGIRTQQRGAIVRSGSEPGADVHLAVLFIDRVD